MTETLQDLMERRLQQMRQRRGRGESISLREAYQRLLEQINQRNAEHAAAGRDEQEPAPPTYEVFRRIRNGHTRITDNTAVALATMLDVDVDEVHAAAGIRPSLGRFELPTRADRLDDQQREVVLAVVDTILRASDGESSQSPAADRRGAPTPVAAQGPRLAARNIGQRSRAQQRHDHLRGVGDEPQDPTSSR